MSQERDNLLNKAYGAASQRLRSEHRDEFNGYYQEEAKKLGVEWSPRLRPEEKAEREFDALLAQFPHLKERLGVS